MENGKPIITEFYNSKGKTFEEVFDQPLEGEFVEEPKALGEPWWKTTIHTFKRVVENRNGHK